MISKSIKLAGEKCEKIEKFVLLENKVFLWCIRVLGLESVQGDCDSLSLCGSVVGWMKEEGGILQALLAFPMYVNSLDVSCKPS